MDRYTQPHQKLIGVALLLISLAAGCHSSVDAVTTQKASKAREWIRENPAIEYGDRLDRSRWRIVLDAEAPVAETMLQVHSAVPLTDNQVLELVGEHLASPQTNMKPFLIRAVGSHVGTAGFEIHVNRNGDVTVIGEAWSHHEILPERRPVVVWLETAPHAVYLWFSVAA